MNKILSPHSYLEKIENYKPGKSKISQSKNPIKLSSNENALKASKKAVAAYKNHSSEIYRYFDGSCSELRQELAKKNNIESENIVCGAGSDEILALLTTIFAKEDDEIIHSQHGFLMYPISAKRVGAKAISVAEKNLKADIESILYAISNKTKIIFIANPNNPTGSYLTKDEIEKLIRNTPKSILIVLDHAYDEFACDLEDYPNAFEIAKKHENVVVTKTFSKIYGLASLRIGWCYASKEICNILNKVRGPFNVSGAAQQSAISSLKDEKFLEKSKIHNKIWLEKINNEITKFNKISSYPSAGNFILLEFHSQENCQKANELLLKNDIILREMSAYQLPSCLRMTIGNSKENKKVIKILKEIDNIL